MFLFCPQSKSSGIPSQLLNLIQCIFHFTHGSLPPEVPFWAFKKYLPCLYFEYIEYSYILFISLLILSFVSVWVSFDFFLNMSLFFCCFACLLIFHWMLDMKFSLFGAGYFCMYSWVLFWYEVMLLLGKSLLLLVLLSRFIERI